MTAQTSDQVSSIAARYVNLTGARLVGLTAKDSTAEVAAEEIRALAASCLRQDEVKGVRKMLAKARRLLLKTSKLEAER